VNNGASFLKANDSRSRDPNLAELMFERSENVEREAGPARVTVRQQCSVLPHFD
jgi:hypothetical protein